jgi:hypothetical protein
VAFEAVTLKDSTGLLGQFAGLLVTGPSLCREQEARQKHQQA